MSQGALAPVRRAKGQYAHSELRSRVYTPYVFVLVTLSSYVVIHASLISF